MSDEDEPRPGSQNRQYIEDVVQDVLYDFDPGGYLSPQMRTIYTDRILDSIGWRGLMELLDQHYPIDVFPSGPDLGDRARDAGPRIISLMRHLDTARNSTTAPGTRTGAESDTDGFGERPAS